MNIPVLLLYITIVAASVHTRGIIRNRKKKKAETVGAKESVIIFLFVLIIIWPAILYNTAKTLFPK